MIASTWNSFSNLLGSFYLNSYFAPHVFGILINWSLRRCGRLQEIVATKHSTVYILLKVQIIPKLANSVLQGSKSGVTTTGLPPPNLLVPVYISRSRASNPESHLTSLQVSPITHSGVWADCDTSNKLYNNDWFLWFVNRSNSSRINRIDWLSCPPKI